MNSETNFLDFKVIREDFSTYKIKKTGQKLHLKDVVVEVTNTNTQKNNIRLAPKRISNVLTLDKSNLDFSDIQHNEEAEFEILNEPTNIYETSDKIILLTLCVKKLYFITDDPKMDYPKIKHDTMSNILIYDKKPPE
jgi:hypothetical protein